MTSLGGHDVIRGTLNLAYYTHHSIIFQTWGRKLPYLISSGSYWCWKVVHFLWKIFARNFACTWNAQRVNKIHNVLNIYSSSRCEQLLKISHQLVVKPLYSNASNFRSLLKFTKICQIDDVIKGSWRHQMKFILSLRHMPIYYLSDLGSEVTLSFKMQELFKLQNGTLSVVPLSIYRIWASLTWISIYKGAGKSHCIRVIFKLRLLPLGVIFFDAVKTRY